jgi:two-component system cell cycle sensor histidine kinase/response regulator CckA
LNSGSSCVEELGKIRAASMRGAEIVRQLMFYSGQESEALELVDVGEVVAGMVDLLRVSVSKHVNLETGFDKNLPMVRASRGQIQQIVMNLITNASEAIGDRAGAIRATVGRVTVGRDRPQKDAPAQLPEGDYLQIEISDTGPGMTSAVQARVFDLFYTTKPTGSHGQGLAVVQRIVQNLRGAIDILSAPGKGATFRVFLPAAANTRETTAATNSPAAEEPTGKTTILVVDDEELLRQAVSKMLRKVGWVVIEAGDGSGALEVIREQKEQIDVLLLDITLPGASSREVYDEAKRRRPGMITIVTSAKTVEMAAASLSTSVEHFLQKPFRLEDLLRIVRVANPGGNDRVNPNVSERRGV